MILVSKFHMEIMLVTLYQKFSPLSRRFIKLSENLQKEKEWERMSVSSNFQENGQICFASLFVGTWYEKAGLKVQGHKLIRFGLNGNFLNIFR